ncbi:hypothetical protein LVB87_11420 [Lysobacter sp. KIS68-7]|uniref:hypothetical protein n=1 Tax=Lysobacter sp. KIS68-7 TaxID=2904252 RepID=UPI001E342F1B|nr:hypothetical protein [Lysobacter sp. KIS68-7]UHQ18791.1 hypothetical protein LVB87_11420 [Lysobacter sp. KIS68-7]
MTRQLKFACVVVICMAASAAHAADPAGVPLLKDLSRGVRLHSIDGQRVWPLQGRRIDVTPGLHTLQFRYAFDFQRAQNGGFVTMLEFKCAFTGAGPYILRSRDRRVTELEPEIWIEVNGQASPRCHPVPG